MRNRTTLAFGVLLIAVGLWFLAVKQLPDLKQLADLYLTYPLNIVAIGVLLLVIGLVVGAPGMAVPAFIVAGIGGILTYQFRTGDYTSWSFMWALIPGFAGAGEIVQGLLSGKNEKLRSGANGVVVSAILFTVFATLFGRLAILGPYGPAILIIIVGVVVLLRGLKR